MKNEKFRFCKFVFTNFQVVIVRICQKNIISPVSIFVVLLFFCFGSSAQKLDVAFVATPDSVVEKMLDMANVGPGDYVIDLGCGDGRINIAAAKHGALGHGVDLDPALLTKARENARKAGVADSVVFLEENIYNTDFSKATVIAMYLFPSINVKLRPRFLEELEPGTRIVSHDFAMDDWKPDAQRGRMETHAVLLWIVPAKVEGTWSWMIDGEKFKMKVSQKFQKIKIDLTCGSSPVYIDETILSGKRISFIATDNSMQKKYVFSGKVKGDKIEGVVQIHQGGNKSVDNWIAVSE